MWEKKFHYEMTRTDSVDNIQTWQIQFETGWHITSHTVEGLVLEQGSSCGTGMYMQGGLSMLFLRQGDVKKKACLITHMRKGIIGAVGSEGES